MKKITIILLLSALLVGCNSTVCPCIVQKVELSSGNGNYRVVLGDADDFVNTRAKVVYTDSAYIVGDTLIY